MFDLPSVRKMTTTGTPSSWRPCVRITSSAAFSPATVFVPQQARVACELPPSPPVLKLLQLRHTESLPYSLLSTSLLSFLPVRSEFSEIQQYMCLKSELYARLTPNPITLSSSLAGRRQLANELASRLASWSVMDFGLY